MEAILTRLANALERIERRLDADERERRQQTLTCSQAAKKLGIKPATLSAYASRYGGLKLENNCYSATKVAELAARRSGR